MSRNIQLLDCDRVLPKEIRIKSHHPSYNQSGYFYCDHDGVVYNVDETIVTNNHTWCQRNATWINEDKIICANGEIKLRYFKSFALLHLKFFQSLGFWMLGKLFVQEKKEKNSWEKKVGKIFCPRKKKFLNKKFSQHPKTQTQTCDHFTFKLPYLSIISHNIEKELQQFVSKYLPDSKLRFIRTISKLKHYFHTKDTQSHFRRSNVVYRPNCSCGSFYIGQARRNLIKRLQEHQTSDTSEVCNHIQSHTDHKVDFNNPQILTHSSDKYKLLILEFFFIHQLKSDLNLDSTSFPLLLFNT